MEVQTAVIYDIDAKERDSLSRLLESLSVETVGSTSSVNELLELVNLREPNLLFLAGSPANPVHAKLLEKIKKQPTVVFLIQDDTELADTLSANKLLFLAKPVELAELKALMTKQLSTHSQIALQMQNVLSKLKLND